MDKHINWLILDPEEGQSNSSSTAEKDKTSLFLRQ